MISTVRNQSRGLVAGVAPKFDRRSRPFYAMLGGSALLTWILLAATRIDVSPAMQFDTAMWAAVAISVATMLRRVGDVRLATAIETVFLMIVMAVVLVGIQYPLAALSGPLVDVPLLRADRALGFDWLTFADMFMDSRALLLLKWAYLSMSWQAAFVLILLAWRGEMGRAWQFVTAAFIIFIASLLLFPFFPADGRFVLCGLHPAAIPVFDRFCVYAPALHHLKDGTLKVIQPSMAVGMVTFPSAHAAAALALAWAVWREKWLRWPSALLNTGLCVGAIVIGSHYLVDIIGGLALGALSIQVAGRLVGSGSRALLNV